MKVRTIAIAALLATAPLPLAAQEAAAPAAADLDTRIELAREVAELAHAEQQLDLAFERMRAGVVSDLLTNVMQVSPERDIAAELEARYPGGEAAFKEEFARRYAEQFRSQYPQMIEEVARYWAENMSVEELEATLAFLRTGPGGTWARLLPGVYEHMTRLGREYSLQAGVAVAGTMMNQFDSGAPAGDEEQQE